MKKIIMIFFILQQLIIASYINNSNELAKNIHSVVSSIFIEDTQYWEILINGTISAETLYGKYQGNGNLCIAQISKAGYGYIKSRIKQEDIKKLKALGYDYKKINFQDLKKDNMLSIIYCSLYYKYKLSGVPPKNLEECARAWKKYYNTIEGKGKPKDFIVRFNSHGLKPLMNYYCLDFSKLRKINIYKRSGIKC